MTDKTTLRTCECEEVERSPCPYDSCTASPTSNEASQTTIPMPAPLCRLCMGDDPKLRKYKDGTADLICDRCWQPETTQTPIVCERLARMRQTWREITESDNGECQMMADYRWACDEIERLRLANHDHKVERARLLRVIRGIGFWVEGAVQEGVNGV